MSNLWNSYRYIRQTITNPNSRDYQRYGHLGCDWQSFREFQTYVLATLGERPSDQHLLSRKDTEQGWHEGNLVWSLRRQIARRSPRISHFIKVGRRQVCLTEYCEIHNLRYWTFMKYHRRGLSLRECRQRAQR